MFRHRSLPSQLGLKEIVFHARENVKSCGRISDPRQPPFINCFIGAVDAYLAAKLLAVCLQDRDPSLKSAIQNMPHGILHSANCAPFRMTHQQDLGPCPEKMGKLYKDYLSIDSVSYLKYEIRHLAFTFLLRWPVRIRQMIQDDGNS